MIQKTQLINKMTLIRTYKQFQNEPLKTFLKRDFGLGRSWIEKHLTTLIALGLIEKVSAIYYTGKKQKCRREVNGYRYKTK